MGIRHGICLLYSEPSKICQRLHYMASNQSRFTFSGLINGTMSRRGKTIMADDLGFCEVITGDQLELNICPFCRVITKDRRDCGSCLYGTRPTGDVCYLHVSFLLFCPYYFRESEEVELPLNNKAWQQVCQKSRTFHSIFRYF